MVLLGSMRGRASVLLGSLLAGQAAGDCALGRAMARRSSEGVFFHPSTIPHCNIPNSNRVPPLSSKDTSAHEDLKLIQVQAVGRHGSRTPFTKYDCWSGYGFKWDCNMTDMVVPSPEEDDGVAGKWLYKKVYDGSATTLGGTCHLGQLVEEALQQEEDNGLMLRAAYIGEGNLKLFSDADLGDLPSDKIYLRSDDDPSGRTEMSGEFLIRGMFTSTHDLDVVWHTGDFDLDNIYPNKQVCPALGVIEHMAMTSDEWKAYNTSGPVQELNRAMSSALPGYLWPYMLDCLMTTACTNRPFPSSMTRDVFDRATEYSTQMEAFVFHWNASYYSRLAMGPFAHDLLVNIKAAASGSPTAIKFGLFLGHDTTLLPLLAAWGVWDGVWPSYASVLSIEVYESKAGPLFRFVYAGRELTLPGCESALCPLRVLLESSESWALPLEHQPCDASLYDDPSADPNTHHSPSDMQQKRGDSAGVSVAAGAVAIGMVLCVCIGVALGVITTLAWNRRGLDDSQGCYYLNRYQRAPASVQELEAV